MSTRRSMKEEEERPPGFEASSLLPFPSSVRSLLGSQVEARHESGPQFSFYGPAGTDFGTRRCRARTRLKTTESPGPARYSTHNINPELVSTKKRQSTSHVFSAPRPASVTFASLDTCQTRRPQGVVEREADRAAQPPPRAADGLALLRRHQPRLHGGEAHPPAVPAVPLRRADDEAALLRAPRELRGRGLAADVERHPRRPATGVRPRRVLEEFTLACVLEEFTLACVPEEFTLACVLEEFTLACGSTVGRQTTTASSAVDFTCTVASSHDSASSSSQQSLSSQQL